MKSIHSYWPLDYDQEVEIYDNPSWDMPGLKRHDKPPAGKKKVGVRSFTVAAR